MSDKNVSNINSNNNSQPILSPSSVRVGNSSKKRSIDDIIDHMTADLQSYEGQYIVLGSPHNNPQHIWSEYNGNNHNVTTANPVINHATQPPAVAQVQVSQVVGNLPIFLQQSSAPTSQSYELHDRNVDFQAQQLFYTNPTPRVQDSTNGAGTGGEMIGMVDVGGGNFVNVVFNTNGNPHGQLHPQYAPTANMLPQQHQATIPSPDNSNVGYVYPQHQQMLNNTNQIRDYGLFNKESSTPNPSTLQPNRQLIENLVGNWLPNQSGTYSPFGGAATGRPSHSIDNDNIGVLLNNSVSGISTLPGMVNNNSNRKPRVVAEVRPMRPTYSDVLTKSPPPMNNNSSVKTSSSSSPSNTQSGNSTPKSETRRHNNNKANKSGGNKESFGSSKNSSSTLRRQHSGSSDDNNSNSSRLMANIHKWMSIEELTPPQSGSEQNYDPILDDSTCGLNYDNDSSKRGEKKQKKRSTKQKVGDEKMESFSSDKVGGIGFMSNNNSSQNNNNNNGSKRSLPINNNFLRNRSNVEKNLSKTSKKGISKEDNKTGLGSMSGSKRSQRSGKRRNCQTYIGMLWNKWQHYALLFATWFINLLWDVLALSSRLFIHLVAVSFEYTISMLRCGQVYIRGIFGSKTNPNFNNSHSNNNRYKSGQHETLNGSSKQSWWKFWDRNKKPTRPEKPHTTGGLTNNMAIPTTGDEAIRRLLSCKGKDPYSILGVTRHCTDDDIKKYYKRQAVLVHPDKNSQPGAEEAFKILVHAFELIGEPERRSRYDHCVAETHQMEHAWTELNDLLTQLHQKMEYTANTIRCTNCGKRHRRVPVQRPCYAARFCAQCKIHHSAREGDIWAESWIMGFVWHYYACMEGQIYNITEWATCQAENLQHLKANSHAVQYRIVLGKQQQNQHEAQHNQQQMPQSQQQQRQSEPDLEEFLSNLYSQSNTNNANQGSGESNMSRHRRKTKRKK